MPNDESIDSAVSELPEATTIGNTDVFLVEQAGSAKRISGKTMQKYLEGVQTTEAFKQAAAEALASIPKDYTALDQEVKTLNADVNNLYSTTRNLFDDDFEPFSNLQAGNGKYSTNKASTNTVAGTKFIRVTPGAAYTYSQVSALDKLVQVWVYEYAAAEESSFLKRTDAKKVMTGSLPVTPGTETNYVRLQLYCSGETERLATDVTNIQFELGTEATEYTPHKVFNAGLIPGYDPEAMAEDAVIASRINTIAPLVIADNRQQKFINFAFATDSHFPDGNKSGLLDIRVTNAIANGKWVDFVAHGGDIFNAYAASDSGDGIPHAEAIERLRDVMQELNCRCPIFVARGNHDVSGKKIQDTANADDVVTQAEFAMIAQNSALNGSDSRLGCSFFRDYQTEGVRIIVLDVYSTDTQSAVFPKSVAQWFAAVLQTNLAVLVITHTRPSTAQVTRKDFDGVINAFRSHTTYRSANVSADYTGSTGEFIGVVAGHSHKETEDSSAGYWFLESFTSYKKTSSDVAARIAVSIFTLDTVNKSLIKRKVGLNGISRRYNYSNLSVSDL